MRILHTSDLHLSKEKEQSLDALKCLIETCKTESVDLLTIGGDMFHKPHDVEQMRTELRKIFSGLDFDVRARRTFVDSKVSFHWAAA